MLKKLIKYDFKWIFKIVLVFIILGIFCSVLGRLFSLIENSIIFGIIASILKGASISLLASALINSIMRGWARFITNQYKDESYLTNTLPIDRRTHLLSKTISTTIAITISFVSLVVGLIICYYNENTIETIKQALGILSDTLNSSSTLLIVGIIIVLLLEVLFIVFVGFFGIVLGHTFNQKKILKSLLFGLMAYGIANTISLSFILIGSLFSDGLSGLLFGGAEEIQMSLLSGLLWFSIFVYLAYCIILYVITSKILNKGINID